MNRRIYTLITAGLFCLSLNAVAGPFDAIFGSSEPDLLHEDQAFSLDASIDENGYLQAVWTIAPDYYLYQHKIKFTAAQPAVVSFGEPAYSQGKPKTDEIFGDVLVYYYSATATVPVSATEGPITVHIGYQGCADVGVCYPPITKTLQLLMPAVNAATQLQTLSSAPMTTAPVAEQDRLAKLLSEANILVALAVFFGLGVLLSFNPCSYPMYPILARIITGQGENITRMKGLSLASAFVLPMAITYAAAGALAATAGENLFAAFQNIWVLGTLAIVLVILALSMFGLYEIQLPARWQSKLSATSERQAAGTYLGAAVMGSISAMLAGACVLPPLVGALLFVSQTGDVVLGTSALFVFGLGMGLPLLVIGLSAGWLLPKAGPWMETVKAVFGILLLAAAIYILQRVLPATLILGLWGLLAIVIGVWLGAFDDKPQGASRLGKGIAWVLLLWGAILLVGAGFGNTDPLRPLASLQQQNSGKETQKLPFVTLKTHADVTAAITASSGPVMLDFYADWCTPCKIMEREVFSAAEVHQALTGFTLIKADVTANDSADIALKTQLDVFNPPSILFFNKQGEELRHFRITGQMDRETFFNHLQQVKQTLL